MSGTVPILDELLSALGRGMTETHVDQLLSLGVQLAATILCGSARIRLEADGLYVPDHDGFEAVVLPIIDAGETIDLLAFNLSNPARWWTRLGAHWALGADALDRVWHDEPLRIFKTPLSWLQSSSPADGLVVVDVDYKLARRDLANNPIIAEDIAHGELLQRELTVVQRPQIRVPREKVA